VNSYRRNRVRKIAENVFEGLIKRLKFGKKDLEGGKLREYLWSIAYDMARAQVDLEISYDIAITEVQRLGSWQHGSMNSYGGRLIK